MRNRGGVRWATEPVGGGINVWHFKVDPRVRRQGRGTEVLDGVASEAWQNGYEYMIVNMSGGDAAEAFLRDRGLEVVERVGQSVTAERDLGPPVSL
jgi:GNAT superfamily N-acetyltransferase